MKHRQVCVIAVSPSVKIQMILQRFRKLVDKLTVNLKIYTANLIRDISFVSIRDYRLGKLMPVILNHSNEYELAVRLREGHVEAFDAVYEQYHGAIYLNFLKLTKDKKVSLSLLQDVFIILWQQKLSIDPERSFHGWLFTISHNLVLSFLRSTLLYGQVSHNKNIQHTADCTTPPNLNTKRIYPVTIENSQKNLPGYS